MNNFTILQSIFFLYSKPLEGQWFAGSRVARQQSSSLSETLKTSSFLEIKSNIM